jgi:hypothetical protein
MVTEVPAVTPETAKDFNNDSVSVMPHSRAMTF